MISTHLLLAEALPWYVFWMSQAEALPAAEKLAKLEVLRSAVKVAQQHRTARPNQQDLGPSGGLQVVGLDFGSLLRVPVVVKSSPPNSFGFKRPPVILQPLARELLGVRGASAKAFSGANNSGERGGLQGGSCERDGDREKDGGGNGDSRRARARRAPENTTQQGKTNTKQKGQKQNGEKQKGKKKKATAAIRTNSGKKLPVGDVPCIVQLWFGYLDKDAGKAKVLNADCAVSTNIQLVPKASGVLRMGRAQVFDFKAYRFAAPAQSCVWLSEVITVFVFPREVGGGFLGFSLSGEH